MHRHSNHSEFRVRAGLGRRVKACGGDVDGTGVATWRRGKQKLRRISVWVHKYDTLEVNYEVLLEMASFFPPHNYLGVGKHHVSGNKICQTLGDALMPSDF
jgi:hypothetical protein